MFFDILVSPYIKHKREKTVEYKKLEELYDAFVSHERFSEIEAEAERILQHPKLDDQSKKVGNWVYNLWFWNNFLETPKGSLFQTHNRFSIAVKGERVDLSSVDAPNFRDKDKYLTWLHGVINS